ncbi:MAG: hypothetical protein AB1646_11150 [Thermodesulfobacteriota bacterium]
MTAEVAILNTSAVALAADSAVTIGTDPKKVYSSANKLFALSKIRPVGVMFFNAADFLGVPWETIIKVYRDRLGTQGFARLEDYCADFKRFLAIAGDLFPPTVQRSYLEECLRGCFLGIRSEIDRRVKEHIETARGLYPRDVSRIVDRSIQENYDWWSRFKPTEGWRSGDEQRFIRDHAQLIVEIKDEVFQNLPLSRQSLVRLKKLGVMVFSRNYFGEVYTGIVVAGFGDQETFPSLRSFQIQGMVDGKPKLEDKQSAVIGPDSSAALLPFAQREMVDTFMSGIDPKLLVSLSQYIRKVLNDYPEIMVSKIAGLSAPAKSMLVNELRTAGDEVLKVFLSDTNKETWRSYVQPVLDAIQALPKDELAAMAEALVNLTSFKRRVTLNAETVGGPVDVAVISKGDGFVWVKHKSYFDPGLNPRLAFKQMTDVCVPGGKNHEKKG